jgi:hypothetical protein
MVRKIATICSVVILVFGGLAAYYHFKGVPNSQEALQEEEGTLYKRIQSRENYSLTEIERILNRLRLARVPDELRRKYAKNTYTDRDVDIINQNLSDFHNKEVVRLELKLTIARTVRNISVGFIVLSVLTMIACGIVGLWRNGSRKKLRGEKPLGPGK